MRCGAAIGFVGIGLADMHEVFVMFMFIREKNSPFVL